MPIIVNRWPCEQLDTGAEILALMERGKFTRLALSLPHVTHLETPSTLPDADERAATLFCVRCLCASGFELAQKSPFILQHFFRDFAPGL